MGNLEPVNDGVVGAPFHNRSNGRPLDKLELLILDFLSGSGLDKSKPAPGKTSQKSKDHDHSNDITHCLYHLSNGFRPDLVDKRVSQV